MRWTNYHGHCNYCDGKGEIEEYIKKAIELNMASIGISSHAPVPFETTWTMPEKKMQYYVDEINHLKEKYKDKIEVLLSLEVDYIPDVMSPGHPFVKSFGLDYVIGSIHFIGNYENGDCWAIDGSYSEFERGLNEIFHGDIRAVVAEYFQLQRDMLTSSKPDIIGHMDKIKMHNGTNFLFNESDDWYLDELRNTLETVKETGCIVEINTKSISKNGLLFPGPEHLNWLKELDIPITINSDAHHPNKLINGFEEVATMLIEHDITQLHEFVNGRWKAVTFQKQGIFF